MDATRDYVISNSYVLQEKLGEGGMGVVYRATHRLTGRPVALKCVRPAAESNGETTDTGRRTESYNISMEMRAALAQEFETLASLHHPHIVSVLDYGFDEKHEPFFTMELLDSPQTILDAGRQLPVRTRVELLAQLLQAVAYLHRRKILHRDIKPSNVLVVAQQVKLLDFGIAHSVETSQRVAGTVAYMAPEVLLGQPPSPASDLYAVGVLAFELLSGHSLHASRSASGFLSRVLGDSSSKTLDSDVVKLIQGELSLNEEPFARDRNQYRPEEQKAELEESAAPLLAIVEKLLARSPQERYQDALQVIRELSETLGQPLPVETEETRESFLCGAEFIGRETEMEQLAATLTAMQNGQGAMVMIAGESGVGKSRLTNEIRTRALVRSARVALGRSSTEGGNNYQIWAPVLRAMSLYTPLSAQEVGILLDVAPDLDKLLDIQAEPPPIVSPQATQARLHTTIEKLFQRQNKPLLVLLEDLQWAEATSLDLLSSLYPIVQTLPVLIVGNYRDDEANETLRGLPVNHLIRLQRLDEASIARLSVSMLGEIGRLPIVVEYLCRQTEGNVFFLIEVVRALAEIAGQLDRIAGEGLPEHLLTGGIERILGQRLKQVSKDQRALLELAAVAGRSLDVQVLQHASDQPDLVSWLQRCANAAVLETKQGEWQFSHDKIRELLLKTLDPVETRQLHQKVAEAISAIYGEAGRQDVLLAYHWSHASFPEKAYTYYLRAGQSAVRLHALVEARTNLTSALQMLEQLPNDTDNRRRRVDTQLLLMNISQFVERSDQSVARMMEAEELLSSIQAGDDLIREDQIRLAKVYYLMGRGYYVGGEYNRTLLCYDRAREFAQKSGEWNLHSLIIGMTGHCLWLQGHCGRCLPYLVESAERLQTTGAIDDLARMIGFQGMSQVGRGKVQEGFADVRRAIQMSKEPTCHTLCHSYMLLSAVLIQDWSMVEKIANKIIILTQETRDFVLRIAAWWSLAWAQSWMGRIEESAYNRAQARQALKARPTIIMGDWMAVAEIDGVLHEGRLAEAIEMAQAVIAITRSTGRIFSEGLAHRAWARALLAESSQQYDEAEAHLQESIQLFTQGEHHLATAHARLVLGYGKSLRGDTLGAIEQIEQAAVQYEAAQLPRQFDEAQAMLADLRAGHLKPLKPPWINIP